MQCELTSSDDEGINRSPFPPLTTPPLSAGAPSTSSVVTTASQSRRPYPPLPPAANERILLSAYTIFEMNKLELLEFMM